MIQKIKNIIRFVMVNAINFFIAPSKNIEPQSILIIRMDAIGDYVLFRNFIKELKSSNQYNNCKISLLGNKVWQSLSEELDKDCIDAFIWLDVIKFNTDYKYRFSKLKIITSQGYDVVLNSTYSREYFSSETIVKLIVANKKIGSVGDLSNIKKWQKNISDKYYTQLIPVKDGILFEFIRNEEFFEKLLGVEINFKKPTIKLDKKVLDFNLPERYVVLFIGASASFRKWDITNFAKIGQYLKNTYNYDIVLCGAPSDRQDANRFKDLFRGEYLDLVGKTTLLDLLQVIYNGNLMLSNETSAPHFAVALEMANIFVIYNGKHYGRFTPYPKEIYADYHVICHPNIEKNLDDYEKLSNSYGYGSDLNINDISYEVVIEKIDLVLNKKKCDKVLC